MNTHQTVPAVESVRQLCKPAVTGCLLQGRPFTHICCCMLHGITVKDTHDQCHFVLERLQCTTLAEGFKLCAIIDFENVRRIELMQQAALLSSRHQKEKCMPQLVLDLIRRTTVTDQVEQSSHTRQVEQCQMYSYSVGLLCV